MKLRSGLFLSLFIIFSSNTYKYQDDGIEFVCLKTHKATNTCHFNFIVNGEKFRHVDMGCKFSRKQEELIKKVKDGTAALAKDWKIDCPEPKKKKESDF